MAQEKIKRIGVLTGGGDCPGLNAVIRAVVKTAIHQYGIEVVGIKDGFLGLIEDRMLMLGNDDVSNILTLGGTILGTSNRANPFHFGVKEGGAWTYHDVSSRVVEHYEKRKLDGLICIGGDGTLTVANGFLNRGLRMIGVPKTIDNDLSETDVTFGFDTAVANATDAIDKIHTTAQSHHRVMVVETMGRYAGWIALCAGLAGGGDIILIPEIPYDLDKVVHDIRERVRRGKRFSILVVAEGAKPVGGEMVVKKLVEGSFEPIRLGGIGVKLADEIEELTGIESRAIVLGHIQRGGSPTAFDRILATRFGDKAVHLMLNGENGVMVSLKGGTLTSVPLEKAVGKLKLVPLDSPLIASARSLGVSFGD
jgi:6-phosphofructokinase 1